MKILKICLNRMFIFGVLILLQVLWLGFFTSSLLKSYVWLRPLMFIMSSAVVLWLVSKDETSAYKISWIILILVFPVFGGLLYLSIGNKKPSRVIRKKLQPVLDEIEPVMIMPQDIAYEMNDGKTHGFTYLSDLGFGTYQNTITKYYSLGDYNYCDLLKDIKNAKHFIFMEYFIVEGGEMWDEVRHILEEKVAEGVEVRFMYDGTCSISLLPYNYPKKLEEYGIRCKIFNPIKPALSTVQNNRDHRKIVVIDGKTAFTGGVNLADEYIGELERFGTWKDTAIMVQGEAVRNFTLMFLEIWNVDEPQENYEKYLDASYCYGMTEGEGYVIPYGDSPLDHENVGELVYMDILNNAKDYVHIMTPYLILDHEMLTALTYAAKRGVDVKIIMPGIPDKAYAFALAKTYYPELLRAGVKIYQYKPGFVHAKSFTSDDCKGVVGTINLDYRSLFLHFECAVYLYQVPQIADVEADFQETLKDCREISMEDWKNEKFITKLTGRVLRLIAPLM